MGRQCEQYGAQYCSSLATISLLNVALSTVSTWTYFSSACSIGKNALCGISDSRVLSSSIHFLLPSNWASDANRANGRCSTTMSSSSTRKCLSMNNTRSISLSLMSRSTSDHILMVSTLSKNAFAFFTSSSEISILSVSCVSLVHLIIGMRILGTMYCPISHLSMRATAILHASMHCWYLGCELVEPSSSAAIACVRCSSPYERKYCDLVSAVTGRSVLPAARTCSVLDGPSNQFQSLLFNDMSLRRTVPVALSTNSCLSALETRTWRIGECSCSRPINKSKKPLCTSRFSSISPSPNAFISSPGSGVTQALVSSSTASNTASFRSSGSPLILNKGIRRTSHSRAPSLLSGDVMMHRKRHCQKCGSLFRCALKVSISPRTASNDSDVVSSNAGKRLSRIPRKTARRINGSIGTTCVFNSSINCGFTLMLAYDISGSSPGSHVLMCSPSSSTPRISKICVYTSRAFRCTPLGSLGDRHLDNVLEISNSPGIQWFACGSGFVSRVQPSLPRASGQPAQRALSRDVVWQALSQLQAAVWSWALCFAGAAIPNAQHDPDFGPHHCDSIKGLPGRNPDNATIPASVRLQVAPTARLNAAPCENPPTTMRLLGMPFFTSVSTNCFISSTLFQNVTGSSSTVWSIGNLVRSNHELVGIPLQTVTGMTGALGRITLMCLNCSCLCKRSAKNFQPSDESPSPWIIIIDAVGFKAETLETDMMLEMLQINFEKY
ncbi:hypothetical protein OGATHE_004769 [Ogataea polymorpha]|uniref:Uncharacterized protein n=1 Tax=Ogataea polymorpha TaxID=460523 RepID=A0A9P8P090_9ASCO|nr:hypothetical protein OGATHE_004769 [Ogataea polymorpha]